MNSPRSMKEYLKLPSKLTDFQWVSLMWESMYVMFTLIKTDPKPVLKEWRPEGSLHAHDLTGNVVQNIWKSTGSILSSFTSCSVPDTNTITSHHICGNWLIMGWFAWKKFPALIVRFQTEAGEHANYLQSTFYYAHTTRHGGKGNCDPMLSNLEPSWGRLCHGVIFEGGEPASHFENLLAQHKAAVTLQRMWCGFFTRHRMQLGGFVLHSENLEMRAEVRVVVHQELDRQLLSQQSTENTLPLAGKHFVLAGTWKQKTLFEMNSGKWLLIMEAGSEVAFRWNQMAFYKVIYSSIQPRWEGEASSFNKGSHSIQVSCCVLWVCLWLHS